MQLIPMTFARSWMLAGVAVLAMSGVAQAAVAEGERFEEASFFIYSDNHGNDIYTPKISITQPYAESSSLNLGLTIDAITAASRHVDRFANTRIDTLSGASGGGEQEGPDEVRYNPTIQLTHGLQGPIGDGGDITYGVSYSKELDYVARTVNAGLTWDFNLHNTTLGVSAVIGRDYWTPSIGYYKGKGNRARNNDSYTVDLTQVIDDETIAQLVWNHRNMNGYLADPYYLIYLFPTAGSAVNNIYQPLNNTWSDTQQWRFEQMPGTRSRDAYAIQVARHLPWDAALHVAYRYYTDDWGLTSHTVDSHLYQPVGESDMMEFRLRYMTQKAVDFWVQGLSVPANSTTVTPTGLPQYYTGDDKLGALTAIRFGLHYTWGFTAETPSEPDRGFVWEDTSWFDWSTGVVDSISVGYEYQQQTDPQKNDIYSGYQMHQLNITGVFKF
ncbi:MAG: hypothetical protein COX57_00775 [Alphaproteobacteria bacterium CG_4_10_14_0_2_um_filter_63_37]|nr:MAG: hypothetical protein AUJ55_07195 [Proteobacteria bacterium CG1_02_64_396]PJA25963.1 MAG: hypothetical protein COX57_00775 [Alphaproteobacteria bacterium CG_4_10_14_0_2_um_filter_63_37]